MKGLKVYSWTAWVKSKVTRDAIGMREHHMHARAIIAAASKAEVARRVGLKYPRELFCLGETGNAADCALALSRPGRVFATCLDGPSHYIEIDAKAVR